MKIILSSFLALTLLFGLTSTAFASTKRSGGSTHKRNTAGKHRTSGTHRSGKSKSNVPANQN
jgi:hypothetical protein